MSKSSSFSSRCYGKEAVNWAGYDPYRGISVIPCFFFLIFKNGKRLHVKKLGLPLGVEMLSALLFIWLWYCALLHWISINFFFFLFELVIL